MLILQIKSNYHKVFHQFYSITIIRVIFIMARMQAMCYRLGDLANNPDQAKIVYKIRETLSTIYMPLGG